MSQKCFCLEMQISSINWKQEVKRERQIVKLAKRLTEIIFEAPPIAIKASIYLQK